MDEENDIKVSVDQSNRDGLRDDFLQNSALKIKMEIDIEEDTKSLENQFIEDGNILPREDFIGNCFSSEIKIESDKSAECGDKDVSDLVKKESKWSTEESNQCNIVGVELSETENNRGSSDQLNHTANEQFSVLSEIKILPEKDAECDNNDMFHSVKKEPECDPSDSCSFEESHFKCNVGVELNQNEDKCSFGEELNHAINLAIFKCEECDYCTLEQSDLNNHRQKLHPKTEIPLNFSCNFCDYKSTEPLSNDNTHMIGVQIKDKICPQCDQSASQSKLNFQIKGLLKDRSFKCDICDYNCSQKDLLNTHFTTVHLNMNTFKCKLCDYNPPRRTMLITHMRQVHVKKQILKCDFCEYKDSRQLFLDRHVRRAHLKERLFKCRYCDYSAFYKGTLRFHVRKIHHLEKIYES